jgi:hypothetical protein
MIKKPAEHATHNLTKGQLEHYGATRDKYKTMLLATQYGMAETTLAGRLGAVWHQPAWRRPDTDRPTGTQSGPDQGPAFWRFALR